MDFLGSGEVVQPNLKGLEARCSLSSVAADGSHFSCKAAGLPPTLSPRFRKTTAFSLAVLILPCLEIPSSRRARTPSSRTKLASAHCTFPTTVDYLRRLFALVRPSLLRFSFLLLLLLLPFPLGSLLGRFSLVPLPLLRFTTLGGGLGCCFLANLSPC